MRFKRIDALIDKSAWILILPALLIVYFSDVGMLKTLLEWSAFGVVLAGAAVMISRIVFPQIHLDSLVDRAVDEKNAAAAIIIAALILFVGMLIYSLIYWAKT